jgi:hypothetical protein
MKNKLLLSTILLTGSAGLFAVEKAPVKEKINRFSIGQDVFSVISFNKTEVEKSRCRAMHYGIRASYERESPNQIYLAAKAHYAPGLQVYTCEPRDGAKDSLPSPAADFLLKKQKVHSTVQDMNGEVSVGYCFEMPEKLRLVPFASAGLTFRKSYNSQTLPDFSGMVYKYDLHSKWKYYSVGMRATYPMLPGFTIGLQAQGYHTVQGNTKYKDIRNVRTWTFRHKFGYHIAAPLNWSFASGSWGITLEPYFNKLDYKSNMKSIGSRIAAVVNY